MATSPRHQLDNWYTPAQIIAGWNWARRLDAFLDGRPKTPVLPIET